MGKKLIVTKLNEVIVSALYENSQMVQVNVDPAAETSILGNIYVGKVKNIVKNINAAFVEIADKRICYLSLDDCKAPIYTTKRNKTVCIGDEFLVQVAKEDVKTKAPVVTTCISFAGKYAVVMHSEGSLGISNKITLESEKKRLKDLVAPFLSEDYGIVLRTNAAKAPSDLIVSELTQLTKQYETIKNQGIYRTRFSLIYETPRTYLCAIRDGFAKDLEAIITDDSEIFTEMKEYMLKNQKEDFDKLTFYDDAMLSLDQLYSVKHRLDEAMRTKVWLKCGGTLIIEPTEALTVIDVNTGKAVSNKKKVQETFFKVNLEAAKEIAAQIRLRNLSGIIIVDFIDMESKEMKQQLMDTLDGYLKKDPIKTKLVDMTALNLVEITRKKVRKPLYEQLNNWK